MHTYQITMDPRKKWTFEYIERELPNIPNGVFVLILVSKKNPIFYLGNKINPSGKLSRLPPKSACRK